VRIELGDVTAVLDADTKRTAVKNYVDDSRRRGPDVAWYVIANRRGRVTKVPSGRTSRRRQVGSAT